MIEISLREKKTKPAAKTTFEAESSLFAGRKQLSPKKRRSHRSVNYQSVSIMSFPTRLIRQAIGMAAVILMTSESLMAQLTIGSGQAVAQAPGESRYTP